jgi:hypothetical protein
MTRGPLASEPQNKKRKKTPALPHLPNKSLSREIEPRKEPVKHNKCVPKTKETYHYHVEL